MGWSDFREFLAELERRGEVRVLENADEDLEIGTLTELMCERKGPMLLFDKIKGYPAGYRIAARPYSTTLRSAIALGLPEDLPASEMFRVWRERVRRYQPIKPCEVSVAPVMENTLEGEAVDLTKFPAPKWHEQDGGRYLGTGCSVITRDPEIGWVNLGTYRAQLHDPRTTGIYLSLNHHGMIHLRKWWAMGKGCPIAVAVTTDPYLFWASVDAVPLGESEYDFAGFLKGEPEEVVSGPHTGLPLPARAEFVLEGHVPPPSEELRLEGPFGEFTGYYAGGQEQRPIIRVQAIYHRTSPILHGDPPLKPPLGPFGCPPGATTLRVWDGLEKCGIPGIVSVYSPLGGGGLTTVVSIKQQYPGHARQVGRLASELVHGIGRFLIVVDDDIDPSNLEEVMWAMATRTDPEVSFEIQPHTRSNPVDPMISPDRRRRGELTVSRAVIIACRPWDWKEQFPAVVKASEEQRKQVYEKWRDVFETAPSLTDTTVAIR